MLRDVSLFWSLFLIGIVKNSPLISGTVRGITAPGWEFIRDLFEDNFAFNHDTGASIAVYHRGRLVVDLQGGWFDLSEKRIYDTDTLQLVFSTTKGLVAAAAALCVQQGLLNYSALVTEYWPEYGQKGKERTTVKDILAHRAGLPNDPASIDHFFNWTAMTHLLEQETPVWPPGTAQGYHALKFGWLTGELIRRVDPKKRSLGQFVQDEIAQRVGLEFYIGLPSDKENRVSPLIFQDNVGILNESQLAFYERYNEARMHQAEIPGANGITNARSLAKLYASLIGNIDGQSNSRLVKEEIIKEAIEKSAGRDDEIDVTLQTPFSLAKGFMLYDRDYPVLGPNVFGHTGVGGSIGFAAPAQNLSFAYVMNRCYVDSIASERRKLPIINAIGAFVNTFT